MGNFISLELATDAELVQLLNIGRFYATVMRCFISSTFDEATARTLIGTKFKGSILRVEVVPYDFTVHELGEVIQLPNRWDYVSEEAAANTVVEKTSTRIMA